MLLGSRAFTRGDECNLPSCTPAGVSRVNGGLVFPRVINAVAFRLPSPRLFIGSLRFAIFLPFPFVLKLRALLASSSLPMASSRSNISSAPQSSSSVNGPVPMEISSPRARRPLVYRRSGADDMLIRRLRRQASSAAEARDLARRECDLLRAEASLLGAARRERDQLRDEVGRLRHELERRGRKLDRANARYAKVRAEYNDLAGYAPDHTDESEVEGEDDAPDDDEEEERGSSADEEEEEEEESSDDDR